MKKFTIVMAAFVVLLGLSGCSLFQSSTVTEEDKKLPESTGAFTGEKSEIDYSQSVISYVGTKGSAVRHEGKFEDYEVRLTLDEEEPGNFEKAKVWVEIQIDSMLNDSQGLTDHLLNEDFFEAETYPTAKFVSTEITKDGEDTYMVTGDLTMKDVTEEVTFEAQVTNEFMQAQYDLDRTVFNVGNTESGIDANVPLDMKIVLK